MLDKINKYYTIFINDIPIIRSWLAISFSLLISSNLDLPLPQLSPLFTLTFFGFGKDLPFKKGIVLLIVFYLIGTIGVFFGNYLIDYPLLLFCFFSLIIIFSFSFIKLSSPIRFIFLLLSILLPFVSLKANFIGEISHYIMLMHLFIAFITIQIFKLIFPVPSITNETNTKINENNIDYNKFTKNALIVLLPFLLVFFIFNISILPLTLVFVLILSFDPLVNLSEKGSSLLIANFIGGIVGVIIYNILTIAPSFVLYALLILIAGAFFIVAIYTSQKKSLLFENSYKTFFIIMGTLSSSSDTANETLYTRIFQILLAVIYVVVAFKIVNTFNSPYETQIQ